MKSLSNGKKMIRLFTGAINENNNFIHFIHSNKIIPQVAP